MYIINLRSAYCALLLLAFAIFVCSCDSTSDQPRAIIISRPTESLALAPTSIAPATSIVSAPPATATLPPLPSATATLSPQIAEYQAVLQYWNSSVDLTNQISDAWNVYATLTMPYDTFDEYVQHKDAIIPASDKLISAIDGNIPKLQALNPPPRAAAYHNATLQYLQEWRPYLSDLRQAIDHNDIGLWNQGVARYDKVQALDATRQAERHKLYEEYIAVWRAK